MHEKAVTRRERLSLALNRLVSKRVNFARWLLEKLLGSFFISILVLYGSFFGFQVTQSPFQAVYFLITFLSILAYIISVVLIPAKRS